MKELKKYAQKSTNETFPYIYREYFYDVEENNLKTLKKKMKRNENTNDYFKYEKTRKSKLLR